MFQRSPTPVGPDVPSGTRLLQKGPHAYLATALSRRSLSSPVFCHHWGLLDKSRPRNEKPRNMFSNPHGFPGAASLCRREMIYIASLVSKAWWKFFWSLWIYFCSQTNAYYWLPGLVSFVYKRPALTEHLTRMDRWTQRQRALLQPWPMGSFPLRPWWDLAAFVCSGLCGLPEFLPYKSTNAPLLHGAWLITCYWLSRGNTDLILSALKHFILHCSFKYFTFITICQ